MKYSLIILMLFSFYSFGQEKTDYECNGEVDRPNVIERASLTKEEYEIKTKILSNFNNPIFFEMYIKEAPRVILWDRHQEIEWADAKRLILMGLVTIVFHPQGPDAYLKGKSGEIYKTTPPKNEGVYQMANIVDPCHIYIARAMD